MFFIGHSGYQSHATFSLNKTDRVSVKRRVEFGLGVGVGVGVEVGARVSLLYLFFIPLIVQEFCRGTCN